MLVVGYTMFGVLCCKNLSFGPKFGHVYYVDDFGKRLILGPN